MSLLRTRSFELGAFSLGDDGSDRLAVLLAGRGDSKDYEHIRRHAKLFAGLGYLSVGIDAPGLWESSGGMEMYTMTNYWRAIEEVIEFFGNRPTVLVGHSRGGSMAMLVGPRHPDVFAYMAVMSHAEGSIPGDSDAPEEIIYRDLPNDREQEIAICIPQRYFGDAAYYDATSGLSVCQKDKLFVYGTRDEIVPPESVKSTYDIASEPKQLVGVDAPHHYRKEPAAIDAVDDALADFTGKF